MCADFKQQAALSKKQQSESKLKDADVPVDSGSSLVGGAVSAVQSAVDRGLHMLPESLQKQATGLIDQASTLTKPIIDSYQQEGIMAAAKTAGGIGAGAVSNITGSSSSKPADGKQKAKPKANKAKLDKDAATPAATDLKGKVLNTASKLQTQAAGAAANLKGRITPSKDTKDKIKAVEGEVAETVAPKKHGRRRRGGRGHGNRKLKTRELPPTQEESIADTLGDKAKQLKDIVVDEVKKPAANSSTSSSSGGVVQSIRSTVTDVTTGISNTLSSGVSGVKSTATGLAAGASSTASGLIAGAQDTIGMGASKDKGGKGLDRKPSLQRKDELPALGTPNTPGDSSSVVTHTADGKLAANPGDQSSLLDKAKFAIGAVQDYVTDKIDNLSMNADDTEPMEGDDVKSKDKSNKSALDSAKKQLADMKDSVAEKGQKLKGDAEKLATKDFIKDSDLKEKSSGSGSSSGAGSKNAAGKDANKKAVKEPIKNTNKEASKDITNKMA